MGKLNVVIPRLRNMYYTKLNLIRIFSRGQGKAEQGQMLEMTPNTFLQSRGLGTMLSSR